MAEEKTDTKRSKPKFLRTDWHKKIRLGRGVKKNQKWHGAKGRHNKFRLNRKGRGVRPRVGWGAARDTRGWERMGEDGKAMEAVRVENVRELEGLKNVGIVIGSVGKKKRMEIIAEANKMKLKILNRYKKLVPLDTKDQTGQEEKKNAAS